MTPRLRLYLACNIAVYVAVAFPGGAPWIGGAEVMWIVIDVLLWRAICRGSMLALQISVLLQLGGVASAIAAQTAQPQPGIALLVPVGLAGVAAGAMASRERSAVPRPRTAHVVARTVR